MEDFKETYKKLESEYEFLEQIAKSIESAVGKVDNVSTTLRDEILDQAQNITKHTDLLKETHLEALKNEMKTLERFSMLNDRIKNLEEINSKTPMQRQIDVFKDDISSKKAAVVNTFGKLRNAYTDAKDSLKSGLVAAQTSVKEKKNIISMDFAKVYYNIGKPQEKFTKIAKNEKELASRYANVSTSIENMIKKFDESKVGRFLTGAKNRLANVGNAITGNINNIQDDRTLNHTFLNNTKKFFDNMKQNALRNAAKMENSVAKMKLASAALENAKQIYMAKGEIGVYGKVSINVPNNISMDDIVLVCQTQNIPFKKNGKHKIEISQKDMKEFSKGMYKVAKDKGNRYSQLESKTTKQMQKQTAKKSKAL